MLTARDVVYQLLLQWTNPADPPAIPPREDSWPQLTPRDRPFAFDLLTGILRWRTCLEAVISSRLSRPWDSLDQELKAALWLGAYQLLMQGGTADYAAVDTAVTLVHKSRRPGGAGLANAVLRGILRLSPRIDSTPDTLARNAFALDFQHRLVFNTPIFPDPAKNLTAHLAATRSHPPPYVAFLRKLFGDSLIPALLLRNNLRPTLTLRVDADNIDVPAPAGLQPHEESPRFLIATQGWNPHLESLIHSGQLSPQDPTAAKPVRALPSHIPTPNRILDLCAGLGTKTLQLARTYPNAQLTATDIDPAKLERLTARTKQIAQPNITTLIPTQMNHEQSTMKNPYDLILIDVPCSNTGVLSRCAQSRWRWPTLDHAALHNLQLQLLTQAASLASPAGTLLYSTCSIDLAENESLLQSFLTTSPDWRILHQEFTLPSTSGPWHDGGYFAILRRPTQ